MEAQGHEDIAKKTEFLKAQVVEFLENLPRGVAVRPDNSIKPMLAAAGFVWFQQNRFTGDQWTDEGTPPVSPVESKLFSLATIFFNSIPGGFKVPAENVAQAIRGAVEETRRLRAIFAHDEYVYNCNVARAGGHSASADGWHVRSGPRTVAHARARLGRLPQDFYQWDIAVDEGWTVAHEAAAHGSLPESFDRWDMADKYGYTVRDAANLFANGGHEIRTNHPEHIVELLGEDAASVAQVRIDSILRLRINPSDDSYIYELDGTGVKHGSGVAGVLEILERRGYLPTPGERFRPKMR